MALLETKFERQSFGLTTVLMLGLLVLMFVLGLQYMDPPDENGILISFGTTTSGAPTTTSNQENQVRPQPVEPEPEPQEEVAAPITQEEVSEEVEELVTDERSEVVIPKEEVQEPPKEEVQETTPKEQTPDPEPKPTPEPSKPDQQTSDALSSILGAAEAEASQGDGIGNNIQGDPKGDPYAASFYGSSDATGTEGYGLSGRSLSGFQAFKQDCDEEGTVVVRILVGKNGRVLEADPGIKGTTNNASCLLEPAKRTALTYRWDPDENAPERQIGFVVIHFKLGQ